MRDFVFDGAEDEDDDDEEYEDAGLDAGAGVGAAARVGALDCVWVCTADASGKVERSSLIGIGCGCDWD